MQHTIENEHLICVIESKGAEVRSLKDKKTQREYIWQINDSIWGSSSPVLFPAIGKIKDNKVVFMGEDYLMPKHGMIRNNEDLCFKKIHASRGSFSLNSSENTKKIYPFCFSFTVDYELIDKKLVMTYHIENRSDVPMPFVCGGHTAYACPLDEHTKLSDYVIEFPDSPSLQSRTIGASGLLTSRIRDVENDHGILSLSETLFDQDALVFSNVACNWVRLRKKSDASGVLVRFVNYPHLALWSKPGADYVCIEPWLGLPDAEDESTDLTEKSSYKIIEPNAFFSILIETEIE